MEHREFSRVFPALLWRLMASSALFRILLHLTALPLGFFSPLLHDSLPLLITVESMATHHPPHTSVFASSELNLPSQSLSDPPSFDDTGAIQSQGLSIAYEPSTECFECSHVMLGDVDEEKPPLQDNPKSVTDAWHDFEASSAFFNDMISLKKLIAAAWEASSFGTTDEQFGACVKCAVMFPGDVNEEQSPLQDSTESTTDASWTFAAFLEDKISLQETELIEEPSGALSLGATDELFSACLKCAGIVLYEEKSSLQDNTDASQTFEASAASHKDSSSLEEIEFIAEASEASTFGWDEKAIACLECASIVSNDQDGEKSTLKATAEFGVSASDIFAASAVSFEDRISHGETESIEEGSEPSSLGAMDEQLSSSLKCEGIIPGIISGEVEEEKSSLQDNAEFTTDASQTSEASSASFKGDYLLQETVLIADAGEVSSSAPTDKQFSACRKCEVIISGQVDEKYSPLQDSRKSRTDALQTSETSSAFTNDKVFLQEAEFMTDAWEVSSLGATSEQFKACFTCAGIILGEADKEKSPLQDSTELIDHASKTFEAIDTFSESNEQFGADSKKIGFQEVELIPAASEASSFGGMDQQSSDCLKCADILLGEDEENTRPPLQEVLESNGLGPQGDSFEEMLGGTLEDSFNWPEMEATGRDDRMERPEEEVMIMDGGWEGMNARKLLAL